MRTTRSNSTRRTGTGYQPSGAQQGSYRREPTAGGYNRGQAAPVAYAPTPRHAGPSRRGAAPLIGLGTVLLVVCIAVAVIIGVTKNAEQQSYFANTITGGVKIDGQDVSGQDVDGLTDQLKQQYEQKLKEVSIKITHEDQSWTFGGEDLGVTANVEEVLSQAAELARTGDLEQRREEAKQIKAEGRDFNIELKLDPDRLRDKLHEIAGKVNQPGQDASVVFLPDNVNFDIPKNIEDLNPPQEEIDKMFMVNHEVAGQTVDVDMMLEKLTKDLEGDFKAEQELLVTEFVPKQTEENLRRGFHLLNAFRTQLSSTSTDARVGNIELALSKFNGYILYPGEELSFNDTTGPRSEANGYKQAPTIGADKALVDDFGGGVCQASTTLYNAALMAGCEVTDRGHHSIPSSYAKKGFDAMVNYPNADLKFKNASDGPIYIKAYVKKPWVYVMIFGLPLADGTRIERDFEIIYEGPVPEPEVRVDEKGLYLDKVKYQDDEPYIAVQSHPELRVKTFLVYKDKNGNEINRKELYEDHFKEIQGVQYVGAETRHGGSSQPTGETGGDGKDKDKGHGDGVVG